MSSILVCAFDDDDEDDDEDDDDELFFLLAKYPGSGLLVLPLT